nr:hypothetical protein FQY85_17080 [Cronobacter turicensis]
MPFVRFWSEPRNIKRGRLFAHTEARTGGLEQIRLRVTGDNACIRHVYEASGSGVTGIKYAQEYQT